MLFTLFSGVVGRELRYTLFAVALLVMQCSFGQVKVDSFRLTLEKEFAQRKARTVNLLSAARSQRFEAIDTTSLMVDVVRGKPRYKIPLNVQSATTTRTASLQSGALGVALSGKDLTLGIWDDGLIASHAEFGGRVIANEGPLVRDHATHVAGTLVASGVNANAKGMAPAAKLFARYFDNDLVEMATLATSGVSILVSNHSYGQATGWYSVNGQPQWAGDESISSEEDYFFGFYGRDAQLVDQLTYLAPLYSVVWAAGNDRAEPGDGSRPPDCNRGTGYDCIIPDATAKNIITVGAVNPVLNYTGPSSVTMTSFSSWGPTDDGRIKPDLVANGVNVFSTSATGVNGYTVFSGTSMATPNVAGSLLLLQDLYGTLHGGSRLRAASVKALAIHTAREAGEAPGPDYRFGWGLLDAEAAARLLLGENKLNRSIEEKSLMNGETHEISFSPRAGERITATLVWTDPAGTPVTPQLDPVNTMLVNDLDLKLVDAGGVEILPWTLNPGNPAQPAVRAVNNRDNVEKIEFTPNRNQVYKVAVSHKGNLVGNQQHYSLILTYTAQSQQAKTLYWVGGSGAWHDAAHWSLTSGGAGAGVIPGEHDVIIFDDNSKTTATLTVTLSNDVAVRSLRCLTQAEAALHLNGNNVSISNSMSVGASSFRITGGTLKLNSNEGGQIYFSDNTIESSVVVEDGAWTLLGSASVSSLNLQSGALQLNDAKVVVDTFLSTGVSARSLKLINSTIQLNTLSEINGENLETKTVNGNLQLHDGAALQWTNVDWKGHIAVVSDNVTIHGNNSIGKLSVDGVLTVTGSNHLDTLSMAASSQIILAQSTMQDVAELQMQSGAGEEITWRGEGTQPAVLAVQGHRKFCFDHLNVENVALQATGVVSAGVNSTLTQAPGWLPQACSDVLFADFSVRYPCAAGRTELSFTGSGNPEQWQWTFPDQTVANGSNAAYSFDAPGDFPVTLSISKGTASHTFTRTVSIVPNTLPANELILSGEALFSFQTGAQYVWLKNGEVQPDTGRSFSFQGDDGIYQVITFDNDCSRLSAPVIITGDAGGTSSGIQVFPNPASEAFYIVSPAGTAGAYNLYNAQGKVCASAQLQDHTNIIPVNQLQPGLYLLEVITDQQRVIQRLSIVR